MLAVVPESVMLPALDPLTYKVQLVTPTLSEYVAEKLLESSSVTEVGVTLPTVGAVVSAAVLVDAADTVTDVVLPATLLLALSVQ